MKLADMVRAGFVLNILAIVVAFGVFVTIAPGILGFRL